MVGTNMESTWKFEQLGSFSATSEATFSHDPRILLKQEMQHRRWSPQVGDERRNTMPQPSFNDFGHMFLNEFAGCLDTI